MDPPREHFDASRRLRPLSSDDRFKRQEGADAVFDAWYDCARDFALVLKRSKSQICEGVADFSKRLENKTIFLDAVTTIVFC